MIADGKTGTGKSRKLQPWWNDPAIRATKGDNEIMRTVKTPNDMVCAYLTGNMDQLACGEMEPGAMDRAVPQGHWDESGETASGEKERGLPAMPVIFEQDEYELLTTHVNDRLNPIPHDLVRFDCAELENPLREPLYETDEWIEQKPVGKQVWIIPHVSSEKEMEVDDFLRPKNETGDRAAYVHSRMMRSKVSTDES